MRRNSINLKERLYTKSFGLKYRKRANRERQQGNTMNKKRSF